MAERRPQPSDELLSAYHDGALDPADVREVEAALAASPELRLRSASLRALKLCVSRALDVPLPAALEARLAARLD
ncbi:MAG: zf-HC2 domain-containing protein, partial [Armatimonadetes bacterium]|nr:zf-HC2 domain-containing protein [Armatimonadota bacterium]